ncbi:hypothetical protein EVAR_18670_1 [Eumeta japonica]|uniref:Uncharacterized protein n=1 Tax=Eumeta variegata TaxID=151549 RepID=A0A4C1U6T3_EUMVA|nr:hypothetical protein EVAR_18670_1 [Eumeta japonica]
MEIIVSTVRSGKIENREISQQKIAHRLEIIVVCVATTAVGVAGALLVARTRSPRIRRSKDLAPGAQLLLLPAPLQRT